MGKYAVALTFLLVVLGCGGSSDTATPVTTVVPAATQAPTTTAALAATVVSTTTATPATAAPTTTATPTTTVSDSAGLSAICTLDPEELRISCHASGIEEGSRLTWTSTASWANSQGSQWDFTIHSELIASTAEVFLEECLGSSCQIVEVSIDTSMLDQPPPTATTTASNGLVADCGLDTEQLRISCKASGIEEGSRLTWTSTASWASSQGSQWDFEIDELTWPEAKVFLEECLGSSCQIVEVSIDTSMLDQPPPTTTTGTTPPTIPPPTTTIDPTTPPSLVLVLPFEIADNYDEAGRAYGGLSFAGEQPISTFGGGGPDSWTVPGKKYPELFINLVPGTTVYASVAGLIDVVEVQDVYHEDLQGIYTNDFELMIYPEVPEGTNRVLINYDHVVNLQVVDGQWVEQGDPIGTGVPMRLMSGVEQPFDFFEWGVKQSRHNWPGRTTEGPQAYCPEPFLIPEHQQFIQDVLVQMELEGFPSGPSICLTDMFADDHTSDWRTSWETTGEPDELSVVCTLNRAYRQVGCNAIGSTEGSRLSWESNIYGGTEAPSYAVRLEIESQFVPEVVVTLTECHDSACETVETSIDTSMLVPG